MYQRYKYIFNCLQKCKKKDLISFSIVFFLSVCIYLPGIEEEFEKIQGPSLDR